VGFNESTLMLGSACKRHTNMTARFHAAGVLLSGAIFMLSRVEGAGELMGPVDARPHVPRALVPHRFREGCAFTVPHSKRQAEKKKQP